MGKPFTVTVIGGGPAGILSAASLANLKAKVTVYERRTHEEHFRPELGWSISFGHAAKDAIRRAGLSPDMGDSNRSEGGSKQCGTEDAVYFGPWAERPDDMVTTTRYSLICHLQQQCRSKYGNRVSFKHGYKFVGGDLRHGEAQFEVNSDEVSGKTSLREDRIKSCTGYETVKADLVVIADGINSLARAQLEQQDEEFRVDVKPSAFASLPFRLGEHVDPHSFAEMDTASGKPLLLAPPTHSNPLHGGFMSFQAPVRDFARDIVFMVVCMHGGGKLLNGVLTCRVEWWEQTRSRNEIAKALEAAFPQIPTAWVTTAVEACLCVSSASGSVNPPGLRISKFVKCTKLGSGRAVVIGDAAHAASPVLGAGCTLALQDAAALADTLRSLALSDSTETPRFDANAAKGVADAWTAARLRDAHAYVDLAAAMHRLEYFEADPDLRQVFSMAPLITPAALGSAPLFSRTGLKSKDQCAGEIISGQSSPSEILCNLQRTFWGTLVAAGAAMAVGAGGILSNPLATQSSALMPLSW